MHYMNDIKKGTIACIISILCFAFAFLSVSGTSYAISDDEGPSVTQVQVVEAEVIKPGVVTVKVDVEDSGVGVEECVISLVTSPGNSASTCITAKKSISAPVNSTTFTFSIPINATNKAGTWSVYQIDVFDAKGNSNTYLSSGNYYSTDWGASQTTVAVPRFSIREEFEVAFEASLSSGNLVDRINNDMNEGETAMILIDNGSNGIMKKSVFDAIKGKNKTIVAYFASTGIQWIIKGTDIVNDTKDVNLSVSLSNVKEEEYDTGEDAEGITFYSNGVLPGSVEIRFKSDYLYNLQGIKGSLFLYYIDDGVPVLQNNPNFNLVFDGTDKWCYFTVDHNSKFVITGSKVNSKKHTNPPSTEPTNPPSTEPTQIMLPIEIHDLPVVKISKPQAAKKKATIKWKKVSKKNLKKIQGVEIQVANDPGFTNIVKSTTVGKKKTSKKISGLQKKTKYWVRVRAYKNAIDGKHVSAWKTKSFKIK